MSFSTKKNNSKKSFLNYHGFTMIEMLITITIFVVAITSATAIFIAVVNAQSKSNAQRQAMQDTRYAIETITRETRMATGDSTHGAIDITKGTGGLDTLILYNIPKDANYTMVKTFNVNNGILVLKTQTFINGVEQPGTRTDPITSDKLVVKSFTLDNFINAMPSGPGYKPLRQPSVTITLTTQQTSGHQQSATTLRTTISSRDYLYSQ